MIAYFGLLYFCSPFVRGSDQFWYVGDLERVVFGDGLYRTNSVFPASMPDDASELPRPWVLNKPVSYIVLAMTYVVRDAHIAWLIFNTFCIFGAAILTGMVMGLKRQRLILFTVIFVLFPFNFYLTTQPLPEIFMMTLVAVVHYLILVPPLNYRKVLLLAVTTGLLICNRANYILLVPLIPIIFYFMYKRKSIGFSAVFIVAAMLVASCSMFFHGHLIKAPTIIETFAYNLPNKTNMGNFFPTYGNETLTAADLFSILIEKIKGAMTIQFEFIGFTSAMFYVLNIMLLSVPILIFQRKFNRPVHYVCLMFIIVHFATIIIFYNQYRYATAIIPSLVLLVYEVYKNVRWDFIKARKIKYAFLAACILASAVLGDQVRQQAYEEQHMLAEFKEIEAKYKFNALMCAYNPGVSLGAGYALTPKLVYHFPPTMSAEEWLATAAKLKTKSGVIKPTSKLYKRLKPYIKYEAPMHAIPYVYIEVGQ
jgi:hypothetical protein